MNRPGWSAALSAGALRLTLGLAASAAACAALTGSAPFAGASATGHPLVADAARFVQRAGTSGLPARVQTVMHHRFPDARRPATPESVSSTRPLVGAETDGRSAISKEATGTVQLAQNWSGEVEKGSSLTSVGATWTVPSVVSSSALKFAATWVGIGGFTGSTLIQAGTIEATATNEVGYGAWVEVLPEPTWTLTQLSSPGGTPSFVVAPRDVMRASVTLSGTDEWQVTVEDATAKWTYSHTFAYSVSATSAEWITERPTIFTTRTHKTTLSTLADYGSTRFTHLVTGANGGAAATPRDITPIRMEDVDGDVISAPGPVSPASSSTGEGFTDSYVTVPSRVYGQTVDGTAAAELEHQFTYRAGACPSSPTSGRAAVLATDKSYPDALASAYLASYLRTGTLLTASTSISAATLAAIRDEGITHVYIVGGPLAVGTAVVSQLESTPAYACGGTTALPGTAKVEVTRIAGATGYDTAVDIATTSGSTPGHVDLAGAYAAVNSSGGRGGYNVTAGNASASAPAGALTTAVLATGAGFQDAEAASTLAYGEHLPILLTTSSTLSPQALAAVETLKIQQVIVMGGPLAVSDAVVAAVEAHHVSVLRVAGSDYTETAIELAMCELAPVSSHTGLGWAGTGKITVSRGDFYTDGLAGAVVAADGPSDADPEPLLLTASPTSLGSYLPTFLGTAGTSGLGGAKVTSLTILGGPLAVSQTAANTMVVALLG